MINLIFTLFGLLPVPGFAGGHVVGALLPPHLAWRWYAAQSWSMIALLVLMVTGVLGAILAPPFGALQAIVLSIAGVGG
jgi:Zn-dependent protease